jgi:hypothetical protein
MTRASLLLLSLALGIGFTGAFHKSLTGPRSGLARHSTDASGSLGHEIESAFARVPGPEDARAAARRKIQESESSTYITEILAEHDSSVARWPERRTEPLTVWVQQESDIPDFNKIYVEQVRQAFEEWDRLQLPVHFTFVNDSADAEVHVNWVDRFYEPISGRTRWTRDDGWLITDANILLALHHNRGEQLDYDAMHAMALHEIGHLLGLDHTADTLSIMTPKVRVRELSDADAATVRLIYALPAGPLGNDPSRSGR